MAFACIILIAFIAFLVSNTFAYLCVLDYLMVNMEGRFFPFLISLSNAKVHVSFQTAKELGKKFI